MSDNSPPDTSDSSPPDTSVDDGVRHTWSFVRANKKNRQDPELAKRSDEITKYLRDVCYPKIAQWEASKGDKDKRTRKDFIEQTIYPDVDGKFDISGPNGFKIQDFQDVRIHPFPILIVLTIHSDHRAEFQELDSRRKKQGSATGSSSSCA
jgi:hypothetical protein